MKFTEFKKEIEKIGLNTELIGLVVIISTKKGLTVCKIPPEIMKFDSDYTGFNTLSLAIRKKLYNLCVSFASTGPEKRGIEKRYYLRLKNKSVLRNYIKNLGAKILNCNSYLNVTKNKKEIYFTLNTKDPSDNYKTLFTLKEIEEFSNDFIGIDQFELEYVGDFNE